MAESTVVYTPDNNNGGSVPAWLAMNNGGFGNGFGGWGGGILGFLLGLFFGNGYGFGGWGNGFGGGNSSAGFLSNQINNDSGRELLMNAITSQGEASRSAVQNLATMVGQDFNLVNGAVQTIQSALSSLALQQAVSVPQIINSIQSGDAALASQLASCCCENRLATCQQTNTLSTAINSASQREVDAIADLKTTIVGEFCAVKEREMQSEINRQAEIITQLRNQADNAAQTATFAAMLSPINTKLAEIESKQPNTIPVQYPNVVAVNNTPYSGGMYPGYGYGYGVPGGSYWG